MNGFELKLTRPNEICAETVAPPGSMIVFGASGDLTKRKLVPSLFELYKKSMITDDFYLLGCGRKNISDRDFRDELRGFIISNEEKETSKAEDFLDKIYYISGSYDDLAFYKDITKRIDQLNKKYKICGCNVYYLSTPPHLFSVIAKMLGASGLAYTNVTNACQMARIVIEKPFGRDLESSRDLNEKMTRYFDESQIYRIDHYLGKETVQNILMFRFANVIFEPLWNRNYIDDIQITIAESIGIGHRAGYYENSGALRDMFQNHMLQLMSLVAMEPPASFDADSIRDEKSKVIRSIRPIDLDEIEHCFVRGQYASNEINGEKINGYTQEDGVAKDSKIETFLACKLMIDNWRWKGVPFYLRSGKRLKNKLTEIVINFKQVPHSLFASIGFESLPPNVLVLGIQPKEGISLSFQAKRPGSKACMGTLEMSFNYQEIFGTCAFDAYQRLLLDSLVGDQTLFTRHDSVDLSWKLFTPVLRYWEKSEELPSKYLAGSESFKEADDLLLKDDKYWRKL